MNTVLLIDDDPAVRRLMRRWLESERYDVLEAANGADGINERDLSRVSIIVTDLVMPQQDGLETIAKLGQIAPGIPILAISGAGGEQSQGPLGDAKALGATSTLAKPFTREQLMARVAELAVA